MVLVAWCFVLVDNSSQHNTDYGVCVCVLVRGCRQYACLPSGNTRLLLFAAQEEMAAVQPMCELVYGLNAVSAALTPKSPVNMAHFVRMCQDKYVAFDRLAEVRGGRERGEGR